MLWNVCPMYCDQPMFFYCELVRFQQPGITGTGQDRTAMSYHFSQVMGMGQPHVITFHMLRGLDSITFFIYGEPNISHNITYPSIPWFTTVFLLRKIPYILCCWIFALVLYSIQAYYCEWMSFQQPAIYQYINMILCC